MSDDFAASAETAARIGGAVLLRHFRNLEAGDVELKAANDFVTRADRESEVAIRDHLARRHPGHGILGEEGGAASFGGAAPEAVWIVDPLDGTTNFIQGLPIFSVSVALQRGDELIAGCVFDPCRGEAFVAEKGAGATRDGEPIRSSRRTDFAQAFCATGFPFREHGRLDLYLELFREVFLAGRAIRRAGSAALDLAWTAAGNFDAFFELGLGPWDIAAGALLVTEAGGRVSDFSGGQGHLQSGNVVAAGAGLHDRLLELLARHPL